MIIKKKKHLSDCSTLQVGAEAGFRSAWPAPSVAPGLVVSAGPISADTHTHMHSYTHAGNEPCQSQFSFLSFGSLLLFIPNSFLYLLLYLPFLSLSFTLSLSISRSLSHSLSLCLSPPRSYVVPSPLVFFGNDRFSACAVLNLFSLFHPFLSACFF